MFLSRCVITALAFAVVGINAEYFNEIKVCHVSQLTKSAGRWFPRVNRHHDIIIVH